MSPPQIRRIVTGHNSDGRAVVIEDATISGPRSFATLVWSTATSPADNADETDGATRDVGVTLPGGTVFRIGELEPGHRSPMHRTVSLDYALVLDGELVLELDGGDEVRLRTGDVVVQRGTNHIWSNDSDRPCRIAFVLIDAEPLTINGHTLEPTPIHPPPAD